MSLALAIKGPEGVVLGAESRYSFFDRAADGSAEAGKRCEYEVHDGVLKLFSFGGPHRWCAGAIVWSRSDMNLYECVPEIQGRLPAHRARVSEYARHVHEVLSSHAERGTIEAQVIVAGFDEGEATARVFAIEIPSGQEPIEQHAGAYGITYGGQRDFIDRLLLGYDSLLRPDADARKAVLTTLPLATMPLADCFELAVYLIRTTIEVQRFGIGMQCSGGPIDVVFMTAQDGLFYRRQGEAQGPRSLRCDLTALPEIATSAPVEISRLATYTVS